MAQFSTKIIKIDGMTCVNCESKIEKALKKIDGMINAKVSYAKGIATVTYDGELVSLTAIQKIIERLDYRVIKSEQDSNNKVNTGIRIVGLVVIIFAIYMIINRLGGFQFFQSFPEAREGMGYGMLFVIGLLTSTHCIAMCGGINLSQCVPLSSGRQNGKSRCAGYSPSLLYNVGRVISYTIIGGIVGALGSVISFSGAGKGIVAVIAGIFMVIMGLNMLNLFPSLRKFNPRLPKIFASKINDQKKSNRPLYVGLLNGLMPCGPLQAMQLYALSTGDPVKGALSMLLFSLGTVPLMFGLGALSSMLSRKFTHRMMTVSAVLVVILGVLMFSNGAALSGYALPFSNAVKDIEGSNGIATAELVDGVQIVTTNLNSGSYEPIRVQAGVPVQWNIQAEEANLNGCNNEIIIPEFQQERKLAPGDNIIEFTPMKSGTVPFSCWMGMIRSEIIVVDDLNHPSEVAPASVNSLQNLPSCCN